MGMEGVLEGTTCYISLRHGYGIMHCNDGLEKVRVAIYSTLINSNLTTLVILTNAKKSASTLIFFPLCDRILDSQMSSQQSTPINVSASRSTTFRSFSTPSLHEIPQAVNLISVKDLITEGMAADLPVACHIS